MNAEEEAVFQVIRGFYKPKGFEVTRIEASDVEKRPDAEIRGDSELALVEIKTKWDAENEAEKRQLAFERNDVYFRQSRIVKSNTHAGVIRDAARQLNAMLPEGPHFRVAWVKFDGPFADSIKIRFRSTLYGIRRVADLGSGTGYDCHDFDDSAFYRWRAVLDAVVLESSNELHLCLNDFSPRYESFRGSKIASVLSGGINDPMEMERSGLILRVDGSANRRNDGTKLAYLREKYGLAHLSVLDLLETVVEIRVPDEGTMTRPTS
jgi:hypothetical protein